VEGRSLVVITDAVVRDVKVPNTDDALATFEIANTSEKEELSDCTAFGSSVSVDGLHGFGLVISGAAVTSVFVSGTVYSIGGCSVRSDAKALIYIVIFLRLLGFGVPFLIPYTKRHDLSFRQELMGRNLRHRMPILSNLDRIDQYYNCCYFCLRHKSFSNDFKLIIIMLARSLVAGIIPKNISLSKFYISPNTRKLPMHHHRIASSHLFYHGLPIGNGPAST